ncbi:MAG TPA: FIST N-terminal domain-containing protein [Armatimonadota bacterium]|nr:FIST N-terminal domain-containing protein [Armatimonadota bacterium]
MLQRFTIISAAVLLLLTAAVADRSVSELSTATPGGDIIVRTGAAENADPFLAGQEAAEALRDAMGGTEPHVVFVSECFERKADKVKVLAGVASVFDRQRICGGSSYGMFTQAGVADLDAVALLGIGGDGVGVTVALQKKMGAKGLSMEEDEPELTGALNGAGASLADRLPDPETAALVIVLSDAHSPKNQLLLDGVQLVLGADAPVTGGSVNKNAGQNWVYYKGKPHTDAAIAIMLTGDFDVALAGRQAKDNDAVISTAREGSAAVLDGLGKPPLAVLAFDCGGRMGKLDDLSDELAAIRESIGDTVPLFGCYCAGEIGPTEDDDTISYGEGWHVMLTALGQ